MTSTLKPFRLGSLSLHDVQAMAELSDEVECLDWLWRRRASVDGANAWCSVCARTRVFHRSRTRASYTCGSCGTHVHPTSQSVFQGSSTPLHIWFAAVRAIRTAPQTPPTARQLESQLGIPYATTRRMRARILEDLEDQAALEGSEADGGEAVRERLLEAASACIAELGYDGARVRDIAERADLSPAAVLYHFDSRAKVLVAALEWATRRAADRRDRMLALQHDSAWGLAGLIAMSMPSSEVTRTELLIWNEYFARTARGDLVGADADFAGRYRASFEQVIAEGFDNDLFNADPVDVEEIIEELLALIDGLAVAMLVGRSWMPQDRAVRILSRFVRRELGTDLTPLITEHTLTTTRH